MCNTYSVISTGEQAARRRRHGWQRLSALVCLLAALLLGAGALHQALVGLHARVLDDELAQAGALAEAVEQQLTAGEKVDASFARTILSPSFPETPELAAVRVWDNALNLTGELTRHDPDVWRSASAGQLPMLGFSGAVAAVLPRIQQPRLVEMVGQLQILEAEQSDLLDRMGGLNAQSATPARRLALARQEEPVRQLAQMLARDYPELAPSLSDLQTVLAALQRQDAAALPLAADAAARAAADFTTTLTDARAHSDDIATLPDLLTAAAPAPTTGWERLCPLLSGQRVLIPLFTPASGDELVAPAGFVEVIYYLRPADALSLLGWQAAPAPLLLLLAIALFVLPRRKDMNS